MKVPTREEFITACRERNLLDLFCDHDDYDQGVTEIASALYDGIVSLKQPVEKYKELGAKDTDVSTTIVEIIYDVIHYDFWPEVES